MVICHDAGILNIVYSVGWELLHRSYASIAIYCYVLKSAIQLPEIEFSLFRKNFLWWDLNPGPQPQPRYQKIDALEFSAMTPL